MKKLILKETHWKINIITKYQWITHLDFSTKLSIIILELIVRII